MTLTERFAATDENLKLDPEQRQRAQEVHRQIGELLEKAGIAKCTRLQGSFARKTMEPPLHDIDKVVELTDELRVEVEGSPIGPRRSMDLIAGVIAPEFPGVSFEVKKHSLGIMLPDDGFDFDAVPGINDEDGSGWIRIADTTAMSWKPSNTYVLIDTVATRNQACSGRFVRQVRMAKRIVTTAGIAESLPGLHTESFCYAAITETMDHPEAVAAALAKAVELLGGPYTDPTGADRISDRLQPVQVSTARAVLGPVAAQGAHAVQLGADGDDHGASLIWAGLFGDVFLSPADEERDALRRLHTGPTLLAGARLSTPPTRAWRPA